MTTGLAYQCCYCGAPIPDSDRSALRIDLSGVRGGRRGATQTMVAHGRCAAAAFGAALHASVPFDVEAFASDT